MPTIETRIAPDGTTSYRAKIRLKGAPQASARGRGCGYPSLARINPINDYVQWRTDGWNSLRYGQGIVVRQRPPVLANFFGQ